MPAAERKSWASWSALPAVLVAKIGEMAAQHAQTLLAMQNCCKSWHDATRNKLDSVWRDAYLSEFEPESASDSIIAADGEQARWQLRFRARWLIERNWRRARFRELPALSDIIKALFVESLGLLACVAQEHGSWRQGRRNSGLCDALESCDAAGSVPLAAAALANSRLVGSSSH